MVSIRKIASILILIRSTGAEINMPLWLQSKTGMASWPSPGVSPPYIPVPQHEQPASSDISLRNMGECSNTLISACSFDCHQCIASNDIVRCNPLSQSFDDGPTKYTAELLDFLKKKHTQTTFFLIGGNVINYPDIIVRAQKEGHLLAVHTWSHSFLPSLSNEQVFAELQWCLWAINATSGYVPRYFRPPYGGVDNRIRHIASQLGLQTVIWDHDTLDWELNTGERQNDEILDEISSWLKVDQSRRKWYQWRKLKATGLILEHDLSRENIQLAMQIHSKLSKRQKRVDQC